MEDWVCQSLKEFRNWQLIPEHQTEWSVDQQNFYEPKVVFLLAHSSLSALKNQGH